MELPEPFCLEPTPPRWSDDPDILALQRDWYDTSKENVKLEAFARENGFSIPPHLRPQAMATVRANVIYQLIEEGLFGEEIKWKVMARYVTKINEDMVEMNGAIPDLKAAQAQAEAQQFMAAEAHARANGKKIITPGNN